MKDFFADYGALVSPILAIVNGLIALVVAQFFKERPAAKIFLVTSAAVLSVAAVTATVVSQRQALAIKVASDARHKEILNLQGQPLHAATHVRVARRDPDSDAARNRDHRRLRTSRTRPNASASTFSSTLTRLPSASAISIRPRRFLTGIAADASIDGTLSTAAAGAAT